MIRSTSPVQLDLGARWRAEGYWRDETIVEAMARGVVEYGENQVVFHSEVRPATVTLAGLHQRAQRAACGLRDLGVGPGDPVAIQAPNWLEGWVAHAAAWICGALVVPIVPIYGAREMRFILRQSAAKVLVVPWHWRGRDSADLLHDIGELPDLAAVAVVGEAPDGMVGWDVLEAAGGDIPVTTAAPDDICLVVYTSGTTADPKGVMHTHNTLLAEVNNPIVGRDAGPEQVSLAAFPSGHVAGVLGILRVLVHGTPTVVMDAWDPAAGARLVETHRVTSGAGAPIYLSGMLDCAAANGNSLATLAEYMTGAANVPPSLISRADETGIVAYRCYGSSEHPTISAGELTDPAERRATTDGRILAGCEVRLVDDEGNDVPTGTDGEIVCRGPEQFVGYLDPTLNDDLYVDGNWLRTGDVGRVDSAGFLTITDRKKDIIVRGGENISSKEVEDVMLTHPAVVEAAALGAPDDRYGERVCVFVALRPGESLSLAEVQAHFGAAGLARQKTPERLEILDSLPRTAAGKVQKFELRLHLTRA